MKQKRITLATLLVVCMCILLTGCKSKDYKEALEFEEAGNYEEAIELFESIGEYKDSQTHLEECKNAVSYNEANTLIASNDYTAAKGILETIQGYKDSKQLYEMCVEMESAVAEYDEAASALEEKNNTANEMIKEAESLAYSEELALDENLRPNLESAISDVKAELVDVPEIQYDVAKIQELVKQMNKVDYSTVLKKLESSKTALDESIRKYALVNAPEESYVIECIKRVPGVVDIAAVTEDNDPNGHLGKAGGYTSAIYFSHENVDQSKVAHKGSTVIDRGTDGGGQIEVYATPEDAEKRNDYLAAFDGGIFASGSHKVIGTILLRTSDELKASEQKELEENLIESLTRLD